MARHPERARHFQRDYDVNRGRFDPDIEWHDGRDKEDFGPSYGKHLHTFYQYEEAESIFRRPPVEEEDHSGKGPKGWRRKDDRIREEACEALTDDRRIDASHIEVDVHDGHITLTGTVESRFAKRQAEKCVEDITGVEDVRNELYVKQTRHLL